ncbi:hypothetical protein BD769DRAFT_1364154, partial [Suillus cothurnatus]
LTDGNTPIRNDRFPGYSLAALNTRLRDKIAFDSRVLSSFHAEVWSDDGKIYIGDTKSTSGTFLTRLCRL